MVKHNNEVPNRHFHKDWQVRVKTWFNQPARKYRRRDARLVKAEQCAPAPASGLLRPIVRGMTRKYNMKVRAGKGFTLTELKAAGISKHEALSIGVSVDYRRRNRCEQSQQVNVARLKAYKSALIVFPNKKGAEYTEDMKLAEQNIEKHVLPIRNVVKAEKPRAITAEEKESKAYYTIRLARSNKRNHGMRIVRAEKAAKAAAEKAKGKKK